MTFHELLTELDACSDGLEFSEGYATFEDAWTACTNVEWMMWLLTEVGYNDEALLRLFACRCVRETPVPGGRTVWDLLTDNRSRVAVEVAERFARGEATQEELAAAWAAAWAAARDAQADILRETIPVEIVAEYVARKIVELTPVESAS